MIKKIFDWNYNGVVITLYEDVSIVDNTILKGRKSDSDINFIIAGTHIIEKLYSSYLSDERDKKLMELLQ
jgi:hypothetical protein